jgi:hypothetical protein
MHDLRNFELAIQSMEASMLIGMPESAIKHVQSFKSIFEQMEESKLKKIGLRLISECTSFGYNFRLGVKYDIVSRQAQEIGELRNQYIKELMKNVRTEGCDNSSRRIF